MRMPEHCAPRQTTGYTVIHTGAWCPLYCNWHKVPRSRHELQFASYSLTELTADAGNATKGELLEPTLPSYSCVRDSPVPGTYCPDIVRRPFAARKVGGCSRKSC